METSVKAAEVLVPPQPDKASSLEPEHSEGGAAAHTSSSSSDTFSAMEEFCRRLQDIVSTHGSAAALLDKQMQQSVVEAEMEKLKEEVKADLIVATDTDISLIKQSLNNLSSAEEKLEDLVGKYADLAALRRSDEQKLNVLQQKLSLLQEERKQLQAENHSSLAARSKLETLCRELQVYHNTIREETLQRCREDEEKRKEMSSHFQEMLTEIQAQIEQHSARNDKLRLENCNLTDKLENLMTQCERREESLEKIDKHHDLQLKLTEARLQQANALLAEAEEKHSREKEYLLREAIDKTKKCFAMKEQELAMKKKLTLYAQKFDDFQETLAKSNEIYVRFREEMNNMSDKMKKVEKESNVWKTRFENCNKALTDMIEERGEKGKEYELFVLKIQKLEKLCRALQDERKVLYEKIKDVRQSNSSLPSKLSNFVDAPEGVDESELVVSEDVQEDDPVLTENMARLKEEQTKLQEFAASLLATPDFNDDPEEKEELDLEEDIVASAFVQFKTKPQDKQNLVSEPELVEDVKPAESDLPQLVQSEEVQKTPIPEETSSETIQTGPHLEVEEVQKQVKAGDVEPFKQPEPRPEMTQADPEPRPEIIQADPEPRPEIIQADPEPRPEMTQADPEPQPEMTQADPDPRPEMAQADPEPRPQITQADPEPETKTMILQEDGEQPEKDEKIQRQQVTEPKPVPKESNPPSEDTSRSAASSKKPAPKKKKKRNSKSTS
ncbi:alpha-taxilin isoform X1 [Melanotaenia boesemani]|uniref:alpha-taxilin isoform X1 n=1 Tax=Melanotaenia boesemani TaxID=1250792 RepID=UPI001C058E60|nr:alpha-taxilin isoform X1 [Melanotaenia boesemani]